MVELFHSHHRLHISATDGEIVATNRQIFENAQLRIFSVFNASEKCLHINNVYIMISQYFSE